MRNPGPEKVKYNYPLDTQLPGSTSLNPGEADSEANSIVSPFLWIIQWWFISRAQISDVRYRSSESPTLELSWEYIIPKRWSQDVRRVQGPEMFSAPKTEWVSTCCSLYHGMGALKKKRLRSFQSITCIVQDKLKNGSPEERNWSCVDSSGVNKRSNKPGL